MNDVIQDAVDPLTALAVGLKVDARALPEGLLESADLTSPATTVALIELGAVLGIEGEVDVVAGGARRREGSAARLGPRHVRPGAATSTARTGPC